MSTSSIQEAIRDHLLTLGIFDHVSTVEPAQSPGRGLYAAIWFTRIKPIGGQSGRDAATVVYTFNIRLYSNANAEPSDSIDIDLVKAADAALKSLLADLDLDGDVYSIDVFGMASDGVELTTDYVQYKDKFHRIIDIALPVMVDSAWSFS